MKYREPVATLIESMSVEAENWHIALSHGSLVGTLYRGDHVVTVYINPSKTALENGDITHKNRVLIESEIGDHGEKISTLYLTNEEAVGVHEMFSLLLKNETRSGDKRALKHLSKVFDLDEII